jgi:hypothetical protein
MLGFAMDSVQLKAQYKNGERDFRGIVLPGVNLVWVELKGVDLRGADLSHANLSGADLNGSNLSDDTNLAFTDLSRVDLRNTNLKGARLEGANLEGVQLEGAVYDENTRFPRGFDPQLVGGIPGGSLAQKSETQKAGPQKAGPQKSESPGSKSQKPKPPKPKLQKTKLEMKADGPGQSGQQENFTSQEDVVQDDTDTQSEELEEDLRSPSPYRYVNPTESSDHTNLIESLKKQLLTGAIASANDWQQTQSPDWTLLPAKSSDFASNSSGQGKTSRVPVGIKRWNWGAFLLPWFWFIPNQVWGGMVLWLLSLIPQWNLPFAVVFAIAFGRNGNEWAWKARPWDNVETFKKHQRVWAIAGFLAWGLVLFITVWLKR